MPARRASGCYVPRAGVAGARARYLARRRWARRGGYAAGPGSARAVRCRDRMWAVMPAEDATQSEMARPTWLCRQTADKAPAAMSAVVLLPLM
jgi:hypothetical protein